MIRTTNDIMCSLLFQASVPPHFWAEALHTATYLLNRLPSKAISAPTPHFALFGTPPSYDHLRVFRCACYPNLSATTPHKLAPRSTRFVFLGYSPDHNRYRCYDLSSRRVIISRHVIFVESTLPFTTTTPTPDSDLTGLFDTDPVAPPVELPVFLPPAGPLSPMPALAPVIPPLVPPEAFEPS